MLLNNIEIFLKKNNQKASTWSQAIYFWVSVLTSQTTEQMLWPKSENF